MVWWNSSVWGHPDFLEPFVKEAVFPQCALLAFLLQSSVCNYVGLSLSQLFLSTDCHVSFWHRADFITVASLYNWKSGMVMPLALHFRSFH